MMRKALPILLHPPIHFLFTNVVRVVHWKIRNDPSPAKTKRGKKIEATLKKKGAADNTGYCQQGLIRQVKLEILFHFAGLCVKACFTCRTLDVFL